jgi:phosphopantetheine--protein transferase-like protein
MLKIIYTQLNISSGTPKEQHDAEHFAAYALLERGLNELGFPPLRVLYTENGKPYFEGNPLYFSLSHTEGIAVCAISDAPVGVDIERIRAKKIESIKRIAARLFNEKENKYLDLYNYDLSAFYEIWVRKEAMVKRTGIGIKGMNDADSCSPEVLSATLGDYVLAVCKNPPETFDPEEVYSLIPLK